MSDSVSYARLSIIKKKTIAAIFFGATLMLSATVSIPFTTGWSYQEVYAHDSGWHEFCWEQTINFFKDWIDILEKLISKVKKIPFIGNKIAKILDKLLLPLKNYSLLFGLLLVQACNPMTVAPPFDSKDAITLACNDQGGAVISNIRESFDGIVTPFGGKFKTQFFGKGDLTYTDGFGNDRDGPGVFGVFFIWPIAFILIEYWLDSVFSDKFERKIFNILLTFILPFLAQIVFAVLRLDWQSQSEDASDGGGYAAHPLNVISSFESDIESKKITLSDGTVTTGFELGRNEIKYIAKNAFGLSDSDLYQFNVYDLEPPRIIFENLTATLEANAHFGFKVNALTIKELGLVTPQDNCESDPTLQYEGRDFYLLSSIAPEEQEARWHVEDGSYTIWELTAKQKQAAFDKLNEIIEDGTFDNIFALQNVTAADGSILQILESTFDPGTDVDASLEAIQYLIALWVDGKLKDLEKQAKLDVAAGKIKPSLVFEEDAAGDIKVTFEGPDRNVDDITLVFRDKNGLTQDVFREDGYFKRLSKAIDEIDPEFKNLGTGAKIKNAGSVIPKAAKKAALSDFEAVKSLKNKLEFGSKVLLGPALEAGLILLFDNDDTPNPVMVQALSNNTFQKIIVVDTLSPDILVLENIAKEIIVNKGDTPPENATLTIRAPLVFDIADPFPTLSHNASGVSASIEEEFIDATLPLGVSRIAWVAEDFSGNLSPEVIQIVNIKPNGTNIVSVAQNQTEPSILSDDPTVITLNSTNPDQDPLEFFLEDNPDEGVILSPIDAIFQNKFQLKGAVPRLNGLVNNGSDILFTDSVNDRVLQLKSDGTLDIAFNASSVSSSPVGIARDGTNLYISDWDNDKIIKLDKLQLEKIFDVKDLFEDPKYISVDGNNIYVTDIKNATVTKLTPGAVFTLPTGLSVDESTGDVFVLDSVSNLIRVHDQFGIFQTEFGDATMKNPQDLTTNGTHVIVSDTGNNKTKIFDINGGLVNEFGTLGSGDGEFNLTKGIEILNSEIFVVDSGNNRIQKINFDSSIFSDDYSSSIQWSQIGNTVTVDDALSLGKANFTQTPSGENAVMEGVFRNIGTTLSENNWRASFELTIGEIFANSTAFVWLMANGTSHPSDNNVNLDSLGVYLNQTSLSIFNEHGLVSSTSTDRINLQNNTSYFVVLDRTRNDAASLSVFPINDKTADIAGSPISTKINPNISGLETLHHANDLFGLGNNQINLEIDDTKISPIPITWIGGCSGGVSCDIGTQSANGFVCTEETCTGSQLGSGPGQFNDPNGIALNGTHIFVTEFGNDRIQIFNMSGVHRLSFGITGILPGQFIDPWGVAANNTHIFVTDSNNHRLQVFDSSGQFTSAIGSGAPSTNLSEFNTPKGISLDSSNNVYVSDGNRIQKFDSDLNFIKAWDSSINTKFGNFMDRIQLSVPNLKADTITSSNDKFYIGDWTPGIERIVKLTPGGGNITTFDVSSVSDPKNIAINSTDMIHITDSQKKEIVLLDANTGLLKGTLSLPDIEPTGIEISSEVPGFVNDQVFVYDKMREQIVTVTPVNIGPPNVQVVFNATSLFSNLIDFGVNNTHVFGLDEILNGTQVVSIRWDKGIKNSTSLFNSTIDDIKGIVKVRGENSILYVNSTNINHEIHKVNLETGESILQFNLTDLSINPQGIATNKKKFGFLNTTITEESGILNGPSGIKFDPNHERIYILSALGNTIDVINATTSELIHKISEDTLDPPEPLTFDSILSLPQDLAFDKNGTLYVANLGSNNVVRLNVTNVDQEEVTFLDIFVDRQTSISSPAGITFGPDDNLYVSSTEPENNNIIKINGTSGDFEEFFVENLDRNDLDGPTYLTFGPDDNLYLSSFNTDKILKINGTSGDFLEVYGDANNTNSGLLGPQGLAFSHDGKFLYVSSSKADQVLRFNATNNGTFIDVVAEIDTKNPHGIEVDKDGNVYVTSRGTSEVLVFGESTIELFVSDWDNNRIVGLDENGTIAKVIDTSTFGLIQPRNMAADSEGDIWIADFANQTVVNVDPNREKLLDTLNLTSISVSTDESPELVTFSNGSTAFVDAFGNIVDEFKPRQISINPHGVSVDNFDNIFVSDWENHRVIVVNQVGDYLDDFRFNSTIYGGGDIAIENLNGVSVPKSIFIHDSNASAAQFDSILEINLENLPVISRFEGDVGSDIRGAEWHEGDALFTHSPSGNFFRFNLDNQTGAVIVDPFILPKGISVKGPDEIYVTDWDEQRIPVLNSTGQKIDEVDLSGFTFADTNLLRDIEKNGDIIHVADARRAIISQFDIVQLVLIAEPTVSDKFVFMSGVVVDKNDNFYITSTENSTLNKFDVRGTLLAEAPVTLSSVESLVDLTLTNDQFTNSDFIYLAKAGNNIGTIIKYDSTLGEILSIPLTSKPKAVAVDMSGNVLVSNNTNKILNITNDVNISPIPIEIPASVGGAISDLFVDSSNILFASDTQKHRIHKFNLTSNEYIGWLGKCDSGSECLVNDFSSRGFACTEDPSTCDNSGTTNGGSFSQFFEPSHITIDSIGNLYVADIQKKNDIDSPRIQKFSNSGFFIEQTLSDTEQSMIKGNFNNTQGIAIGKKNFYVIDVETLHVFDVNPFSAPTIDLLTNNTFSDVTYQSIPDFLGNDAFKFKVSDGFQESNIAQVNITVNNPDPDGDGIFSSVDTAPNTKSNSFNEESTASNGKIVKEGDQTLKIRNARDVDKGVFIQADVRGGTEGALVSVCNDSTHLLLNAGNRIIVTCGNGAELDIVRGNIQINFTDSEGRKATATAPIDSSLFFNPEFFEIISFGGFQDINFEVMFNGVTKSYLLPLNDFIRVDKAPPVLPEECSGTLTLEAESIFGVNFSSDVITDQFTEIIEFLTLEAVDEDNGVPLMTDGDVIVTTNNVTIPFFRYTPSTEPTETTVIYTAIDEIGNNSTCSSIVKVQDKTDPTVTEFPDVFVITPSHSDVAVINFDLPDIIDLPLSFGLPGLEVTEKRSGCILASGSEYPPGIYPVNCKGTDLADNSDEMDFEINVDASNIGVQLEWVNASGTDAVSTVQEGDQIIFKFTKPTNMPPVSTKEQIDSLIDVIAPSLLGADYEARFTTPSIMKLTIIDSTGTNLASDVSQFQINSSAPLKNAPGTENFTSNLVTLQGGFDQIIPPFITAFVAEDPVVSSTTDAENNDEANDDLMYSVEDTFTIRFSEATNQKGTLSKDDIKNFFKFMPFDIGEDYTGTWINPSTFRITITELNRVDPDPLIGVMTVKVLGTGDIKNRDETSLPATSISPPLSGAFSQFRSFKTVEVNGTASVTMPSGVIVSITIPPGDPLVTISKILDPTAISISANFIGEKVNIFPGNRTVMVPVWVPTEVEPILTVTVTWFPDFTAFSHD